MLEQLQAIFNTLNSPTHPHVGEAYQVNQALAAYYFLRSKAALYVHHCQAPALKGWWQDAAVAIQERIGQLEAQSDRLGIPRPPTMPSATDLTDQFMAIDGLAMVKGMLQADVIGLQSALHPDLATLHYQMLNATLVYGRRLVGIMEQEGWAIVPPTYQSTSPH